VRDPTPLGDPELDDALTVVGTGVVGHKVTRLADAVPKTHQLLRRLVAQEVLTEQSHRRLGMFTVRRYHPTPAAGRDELASRLRSALLGEAVPDERTALLASVLVDVHWKLFVPRKRVGEAFARAKEILERISEDERAVIAAVREAMGNSGGHTSIN
jgi:hypothetical protein